MFIVYTQKYSSPVLTHVINTAPIAAEIKTSIIDGEISGWACVSASGTTRTDARGVMELAEHAAAGVTILLLIAEVRGIVVAVFVWEFVTAARVSDTIGFLVDLAALDFGVNKFFGVTDSSMALDDFCAASKSLISLVSRMLPAGSQVLSDARGYPSHDTRYSKPLADFRASTILSAKKTSFERLEGVRLDGVDVRRFMSKVFKIFKI